MLLVTVLTVPILLIVQLVLSRSSRSSSLEGACPMIRFI